MSTSGAGEWDLVVPDDGAELLAELRRHGVRPGQRLHLRAVTDDEGTGDPLWDAFLGSGGDSGDPDLSIKAKQILRDEMGT